MLIFSKEMFLKDAKKNHNTSDYARIIRDMKNDEYWVNVCDGKEVLDGFVMDTIFRSSKDWTVEKIEKKRKKPSRGKYMGHYDDIDALLNYLDYHKLSVADQCRYLKVKAAIRRYRLGRKK